MLSIPRTRRLALLLIVPIVALIGAACDPSDPAQRQAFYDLNPEVGAEVTAETLNEPQRAVISHLQDQQLRYLSALHAAQQRPRDCYAAMEQVFPPHAWSWGRSIIHRESRNNPSAANPSSTARGCWQLLSSLHAGRYTAVGCHVSQWSDALCNTKAAYELYKVAGTSPWRL